MEPRLGHLVGSERARKSGNKNRDALYIRSFNAHKSLEYGVGLSFSKPSRGEEAWSFAQAKVPKPNASDWSRWSGMNVFAGNSLTPYTPYWKIKDYPMMRNTSQVSYYKLIR
jgi:hypothetical protein